MRPRGVIALVVAGAFAVCSFLSCSAGAEIPGRYNVEACTEAVDYANNSWQVSINNLTYLEDHTSCGERPVSYESSSMSNLEVADVMELPEEAPLGVAGQWRFEAPVGADIVEVTGNQRMYRDGGHGWQVYRESELPGGSLDVEESCDSVSSYSCQKGGQFQAVALNAKAMIFGVRCTAEEYASGQFFRSCPPGALWHYARAGINEATVTLEDLTPPAEVTANSVPTGPQHGTIVVEGSAEDSIAGLLALSVVTASGQVVGGPVSAGACDYSKMTPCPVVARDLPISIDTAALADGEYHLQVQATNAAHDHAYSAPFAITVENHPQGGEESPGGGTGGGGGGSGGGEAGSEGGGAGSKGGDGGSPVGEGGGKGGGGSTPGGPGGKDGSGGKDGATSKQAGSGPAPARRASRIWLRSARVVGRRLTIAGTAAIAARGQVHLVLSARRGKRTWRARMVAALRLGRLHASAKLPAGFRPGAVWVKLCYPGTARFRPARRHRRMVVAGRSRKAGHRSPRAHALP